MRSVVSVQVLALVLVVVVLTADTSVGQVCGDVNGDGMVTETDGVLVLREAALLPARRICEPAPSGCDLTDFTNGPNPGSATSVWDCRETPGGSEFALYSNFTGSSANLGPFSFLQDGCLSGILTALSGELAGQQATITDIRGSRARGILQFHQAGFGANLEVTCRLVIF